MKIAVDAMGGDNAPLEIVKGAYLATVEQGDVDIVLIGDQKRILECFSEMAVEKPENIQIINVEGSISMDDEPMVIMSEKNNSSMAVGLSLLKDNLCDVFISAGNTGALHVGSTLMLRRIKGVRRAAIATVLPFENPVLMLDSGANTDVTADIFLQWAIIGSSYAEHIFSLSSKPRVGLLNIGTEENKGTAILKEAYKLLENDDRINFVGNVESKQLFNNPCDVLLTDGFTGNITLKLMEGFGAYMFSIMKELFEKNLLTKLSFCTIKNNVNEIKNTFDPSEYGGAPILGLAKLVIKAHGSSRAYDVKNAIISAKKYYESDVINKISKLF